MRTMRRLRQAPGAADRADGVAAGQPPHQVKLPPAGQFALHHLLLVQHDARTDAGRVTGNVALVTGATAKALQDMPAAECRGVRPASRTS